MKNYYKLKFQSDFFKKTANLEFKKLTKTWDVLPLKWNEYVSNEIVDDLKLINVFPENAIMFTGCPNSMMPPHTDANPNLNLMVYWSINVCWGSEASAMIWYRALNDNRRNEYTPNSNKIYVEYDMKDLEEIDRSGNFVGVYLTRLDLPHKVINFDDKNIRYAFSLRCKCDLTSWEDVVNNFKRFIVE